MMILLMPKFEDNAFVRREFTSVPSRAFSCDKHEGFGASDFLKPGRSILDMLLCTRIEAAAELTPPRSSEAHSELGALDERHRLTRARLASQRGDLCCSVWQGPSAYGDGARSSGTANIQLSAGFSTDGIQPNFKRQFPAS